MVQFARRTDGTGLAPYAIKFFLMRSVYEEEADMYRNSPPQLKHSMPKVVKYVPNVDKSIFDPFGNPLPPFIVMEKGESLRDRTRDTPVDVFTAAQVLARSSLPHKTPLLRLRCNNHPPLRLEVPSTAIAVSTFCCVIHVHMLTSSAGHNPKHCRERFQGPSACFLYNAHIDEACHKRAELEKRSFKTTYACRC